MPVFNSQSMVSSSNYLNKTTGKHATCTKGHDERTERTVKQQTCKKQHLIVLTVRIIFWNSSLKFLVFIFAIHVPQRLNSFILKNLDSVSNEILFRVLGSKFRMGYLKFIKKRPKKTFKRSLKAMLLDILQTEDSYVDVDTIIVKMKK